jgi:predicted 2-oxoglutarate/Fe(II)-dependent dioxygenase YbiX
MKAWNVGIVLNNDFDGGDYIIYDENDDKIIIDKKIGNVCLYQSQTPHEVTPVLNGERWSIAMFITNIHLQEKTIL